MKQRLYAALALAAAAGFLLSMAIHLRAWAGHESPVGSLVFLLHLGIFPLWIPLVLLGHRTKPPGVRDNYSHLLAALPRWVKPVQFALFIYAMLNFLQFFLSTSNTGRGQDPPALVLRGFSGHWLLFYSAAAFGFWGLARLEELSNNPPSPQA